MSYFDRKQPVETICEEGTSHEYKRLDHDAFGQITVQRVRPGGPEENLFLSDLKHGEVIQVTLRRGHIDRRNHRDDLMEDEILSQFHMSSRQWADLVTSSGLGTSIPVTLRYAPARGVEAVGMPMIDIETLQERQSRAIKEKFQKYMETGLSMVAELQRLSDAKGAPSKGELRELLSNMRGFVEGLPNNFAYMNEVMQDSTADMLAHAKTEFDAHVASVASRAGFASLAQQLPAVPPSVDPPKEGE